MTKKFNIDEIRTIVNSVPGHYHGIPPTMEEQKLEGAFRVPAGPIYISRVALIKRFEESKSATKRRG